MSYIEIRIGRKEEGGKEGGTGGDLGGVEVRIGVENLWKDDGGYKLEEV